jgi:hypothetical protein
MGLLLWVAFFIWCLLWMVGHNFSHGSVRRIQLFWQLLFLGYWISFDAQYLAQYPFVFRSSCFALSILRAVKSGNKLLWVNWCGFSILGCILPMFPLHLSDINSAVDHIFHLVLQSMMSPLDNKKVLLFKTLRILITSLLILFLFW